MKGEYVINKIIDLHCDTLSVITENNLDLYRNTCHFDLHRAMEAGVSIQFFALFAHSFDPSISLKNILLQVEKFYKELFLNQSYLYLITEYVDIKKNQDLNKIGAILHLEGAEAIGNDIELLDLLYRLGLRSMGLTWNHRNLLADGIGDDVGGGGLSKLGKKVLKQMQKLKMFLDLSHISEQAYFEVFDYYDYPIMATHSNVRQICSHKRNLTDEQIKVLAQNDGLIGLNQVTFFTGSDADVNINSLINHMKYIADRVGIRHIALGSDFDGTSSTIMSGVQDYSYWSKLLLAQGFMAEEIDMILYQNAERVIKKVLD